MAVLLPCATKLRLLLAYDEDTGGVCWNKADQRWKADISVNGKKIYLGYFKHKDEAVAAINAARPVLHGEFARSA
jgi:hypothetical protein